MYYRHLNLEERERLYAMKEQGMSLRRIAKKIGRSQSSLTRELKRNKTGEGKRSHEYFTVVYIPCRAQKKAEKRAAKQRYKAPLKNPEVFLYVRKHLRMKWSPETIAGRIRIDPSRAINLSRDDLPVYLRQKEDKKKMRLQECLNKFERSKFRH